MKTGQRRIPHGTRGGWTNHGCRCELCESAEKSYQCEYSARRSEQKREYLKDWRSRNPDYDRNRYSESERERARKTAAKAKRRARLRDLDHGCIDAKSLTEIVNANSGKCFYCGGKYEHFDHFIPLSRGGMHCVANIRLACASCNYKKGSKMPDIFAAENDITLSGGSVSCEN